MPAVSCTLTIIADASPASLSDAALRSARDRLTAAEVQARPVEMVQALSGLASCYRRLRAAGVTEALFEQALVWGRAAASNDLMVDLLCDLCEFSAERALDEEGAGIDSAAEKARTYAAEAARLAPAVADSTWEIRVLLRIGDVYDRLGDHVDAVAVQTRALALMGSQHGTDPDTLARTLAAHTTLQ